MLNINDIKRHLNSTIPKYGIRLKKIAFFQACSLNDLKIICICEPSAFLGFLDKNELKSEIENNCNKRYLLVNLMMHESLGHFKFSLNFFSFYNGISDNTFDEKSTTHYSEPKSPKIIINIKARRKL